MLEEWPLWRLVTEKIATWTELNKFWSLDDALKANAIIDAKAAIQEAMTPKGKIK